MVSAAPADPLVTELIRALALGWKTLAGYPPGHPARATSLARIADRLRMLHGVAPEVAFGVAPDGLRFAGQRIDSAPAEKLVQALYARGVGELRFEASSTEDLETFLRLLGTGAAPSAGAPLWECLAEAGVQTIHLQPVDYSRLQVTDSLEDPQPGAPPEDPWQAVLRALLAGDARPVDGGAVAAQRPDPGDELPALILECLKATPETSPAEDASGARAEAVSGALSAAVSAHLADSSAASKRVTASQLAKLLKMLPASLAPAVTRGVLQALGCHDGAGPLLRDLVRQLGPDEARAALRELATVANLSPHAVALLRSLSAVEEPPAAPPPIVSQAAVSELVDLFGEDDPDRFNPEDHRQLLESASLQIPPLVPSPQSGIEVLGSRVETVRDAEVDRLLSRTLLELLTSLGAGRDPAPILRRVQLLFRSYLAGGEFADALDMFQRLRELSKATASDVLRAALDRNFAELASPEATRALVEGLLHARADQVPTLQGLIEIMGAAATRSLLLALAEETHRSRRRKLFDVVSRLGQVVVPEVVNFLDDPRWYVVRNMIALLRAVNDRTALHEVRRLLAHPDARVRLEAIKALVGSDPTLPVALLNDAVNDPDPKLAETAIGLVGSCGVKEGMEPLLSILSRRDPFGVRRPLRLRAIKALGELGVPEALPRMSRFFRRPFLPGPKVEERRAAFESLAGYPGEARAPYVARGLRSRDRQVRAICRRLAG